MRRLWVALALVAATASASAAEYSYVPAGSFGRRACGSAPAGWRNPDFDDRAWSDSAPPDGGVACAATVMARWRFDAGPELTKLATITLRIRYEHGFAAYLNGVEIARRRLDTGADAAALASETHGPEWDRISLPLTSGLLRPSGNVLSVEVHPRTLGHSPLIDVELTAADGPRIVRGPYLSRLSEREVTVLFDTDLPTLGEVRWGRTDAYGSTASDSIPQVHHALRLRGLAAASAYHYRAVARGNEIVDAGDASFHTPPPPGRPLRFVVYGDVRSGHDVHALLARSILEEDPDLALVTGDLVDRGSDEGDWEKFFEVEASLLKQVAIFPAVGNHEYARLGRGIGNFLRLFRWPLRAGEEEAAYYSFDAGGAHFVALDSNQYGSTRQLEWLDQDLSSAEKRGARALIVYAHEGAWSSGLHGDNSTCVKEFVPVLERHHVAMFFYGHDHDYERGHVGKLDYIVTGGGGAELRATRCGPGKRPCPPRVAEYINDHNYVAVELLPSLMRTCPKRPDGTALAPCTSFPLRK